MVFTQAILRAMRSVENVNPAVGAVTVQRAFRYAEGEAEDQSRRLRGSLDHLPLPWPVDPAAAAKRTPVSAASATAGGKIKVTFAEVERRQAHAEGKVMRDKAGTPRTIEVDVVLSEDAESLRLAVYYLPDHKRGDRAAIEMVKNSPDGPQFRKGVPVRMAIPLYEGLTPGTYEVAVEPCEAGGICGKETPATLQVVL